MDNLSKYNEWMKDEVWMTMKNYWLSWATGIEHDEKGIENYKNPRKKILLIRIIETRLLLAGIQRQFCKFKVKKRQYYTNSTSFLHWLK